MTHLHTAVLSLILYAAFVHRTSAATHKLPPLPYSRNALEPHTNAQTLDVHHKKHHLKYVNTLNQLVDKTDLDGLPLEQVMEAAAERNMRKVYNNAAQAWNHEFYFKCMRPPPSGGWGKAKDAIVPDRKGIIGKAIKESFGNYKVFRHMFVEAANNAFGSGWAWLVYDATNDVLEVKTTIGADNPITADDGEFVPLLTIDVWEHAYYLDYQNLRSEYVDAFVDYLIDWSFVEENLKNAIKDSESGSSRLASGEL